jgi:glycosyltransferase involved in cell wall biosynthesis
MTEKRKKVLVFSTVHNWNDVRIFYRQVTSLKKYCDVELHAAADFEKKVVDGVTVYGLPRWNSLGDRLRSLREMMRRLRESDADVFHFHDPELLLLVPWLYLRKRKTIIFDVHEHYPRMILEKAYLPKVFRLGISAIYRLFELLTLPFVERVIYVTDVVGERYVKIKKERAYIVKNVPLKEMFAGEPADYRSRSDRAVFLGYVEPIRGVAEIIRSLPEVTERYPGFSFEIYGRFFSAEYEAELNGLVKQLGLENNVIFHGMVPYEEIARSVRNAKIGYITYLPLPNNMAGLPNKLFEYMGSGLAIIASDFETYRGVINGDVTSGLLVHPEKPDEIAAATLKLLGNEELAAEYAANARATFLNKYNWQAEEANLLKAYEGIIELNGQ